MLPKRFDLNGHTDRLRKSKNGIIFLYKRETVKKNRSQFRLAPAQKLNVLYIYKSVVIKSPVDKLNLQASMNDMNNSAYVVVVSFQRTREARDRRHI